ncbi:MAG: cytosine permease [Thermoanaerobacteraceae bacterium]|jgi:cytosine permease|nr:cytosine permease [Thermoanaerobacteraceae bacterium]MDN5300800.1 cytosine permease [Thermoanaerobacteraceae bacterium]
MAVEQLDKLFEDYGVEPVPENSRKDWLSMGLIWAGVGISLGLLMTGGALGNGLSFRQSIVASFIGGAVLAIVTALCGIIGAKTNLSTAMISRFTFGDKAVLLIALIQAFGSYGWFGVQLGLFGKTAATAWSIATGGGANVLIFIVLGGLCMILTATIGYRGLDFLSKLAVPLLLVLMGGSVWKVLQKNSLADIMALQGTGEPISLGLGISMVISSFIVGAVVAPDVSRYAKSPKDTIGASILAFAIVVPIIMLIGAVMAQAAGTWDLVDIMLKLGWGLIALLVLLLAQWTSNDNNLYCSALGFAVIFRNLKKWHLTVLSGILGIILALWGIYDRFIPWLLTLGVLIPPMGGVMAVDYYIFNSQYYQVSYLNKLPNIRMISAAAWIIGSVVSFITSNKILSLTTVPALDGFLISAIIQYILISSTKSQFNSTFFEKKTV